MKKKGGPQASRAGGLVDFLRPIVDRVDFFEPAEVGDLAKEEKVYRSFCRMCHGGCGALVFKEGERITRVEGDPTHPLNLGSLCAKGQASIQQLYSPFRLNYPLIRVGERGEGKWRRATWDEALDYIAHRMLAIKNEYGAEAVAMGQGTGRLFFMAPVRLCNAFGTPNWMEPGWQQCLFPRVCASFLTLGSYTMPDYYAFGGTYPSCMFIWGVNPAASNDNGNIVTRLMKARTESGAKLVVIDPRLTAIASKADLWLSLRPGTDDALAMGMLNVILTEKLYDEDFLIRYTNAVFLIRDDNGLALQAREISKRGEGDAKLLWDAVTDSAQESGQAGVRPELFGTYLIEGIKCKTALQMLKERVSRFTPEETARITWVPAEKILHAARLYATHKPSSIQCGVALDHTNNTVQTARAVWLLPVLCGNVDVPGGNVFGAELPPVITCYSLKLPLSEKLPPEQLDKQIGADTYLLGCGKHSLFPSAHIPSLMKTIISGKPYPIKGMLVFGGNHFMGCADSKRLVYEAYRKLDFLMVADLFMTPVAQLADVVLPAAGWLERSSIAGWPSFCDSVLGFQQKTTQLFQRKEDELICIELARRLGLEEHFPWKDMDEYMEYLCSQVSQSWSELKDGGAIQGKKSYRQYDHLHTPSGKMEIYSSALHSLGYDPLPFYREPAESPVSTPELTGEFPFILITGGRSPGYMHSEHHHLPWLRALWPAPSVEMNPETAKKLGIWEGDWVWLETKRGRCKQRAKLTNTIHPQVVHGEHAWWFPERAGAEPGLYDCWESNINLLTDGEHCDPIIGSSSLRALLCKVYPT